jgi:hypothetical protein
MKRLLLAILAALPLQAAASEEDPIAYKCYYCTPAEMEVVALAQGVGKHYVYDAVKRTISGFNVTKQGEHLEAASFLPESWLVDQFHQMLNFYNSATGETHAKFSSYLLAPDTEHGRSSRYLWGHHLTALHPRHSDAREWIHRFLMDSLTFLNGSDSGGKLLRFEHMLDGTRPLLAEVRFISPDYGTADFYFDHDSRRWRYLGAEAWIYYSVRPLQESRDDFAPKDGKWEFRYRRGQQFLAQAFKERAIWAGIPVSGTIPPTTDVTFTCEREAEDIRCSVE